MSRKLEPTMFSHSVTYSVRCCSAGSWMHVAPPPGSEPQRKAQKAAASCPRPAWSVIRVCRLRVVAAVAHESKTGPIAEWRRCCCRLFDKGCNSAGSEASSLKASAIGPSGFLMARASSSVSARASVISTGGSSPAACSIEPSADSFAVITGGASVRFVVLIGLLGFCGVPPARTIADTALWATNVSKRNVTVRKGSAMLPTEALKVTVKELEVKVTDIDSHDGWDNNTGSQCNVSLVNGG